jgi:secondary thiamine-phosphate synthase enzyme
MQRVTVRTHLQNELVDITAEVATAVKDEAVGEGVAFASVPHTTAGITLNENADPSVKEDIVRALGKLVPQQGEYRHMEGNAAAHIKTCLVGNSVAVPVSGGKLVLGTWQGIFLAEFDGPRTREVHVQVVKKA